MIIPRFRLKGLSQFRRRLRMAPMAILRAAAAELMEEAEETITDAKVLTPVDTGNLRASGHVAPPVFRGMVVTIRYGFGGPGADYARPVHENVEVFGRTLGGGSRNAGPGRFKRHRGGRRRRIFVGQAKYLSTAILARSAGRTTRLVRGISRRLRFGR